MRFFNIKTLLAIFLLFIMNTANVFAESATSDFSIIVPSYLQIKTITNPVLTANITDKTGNLYAPLTSRFKVISNIPETQTLYLKANTVTENGIEEAMFESGGRVYVAFANVKDRPKSQSLKNCMYSGNPKESPGVVAYPITSIIGAKHKYKYGQGKYEVYIENGVTDISVNIGSNVLLNTFSTNDPKGFYQATLSLTEADI